MARSTELARPKKLMDFGPGRFVLDSPFVVRARLEGLGGPFERVLLPAVFLFFIFIFYKNIFSFSKFTEIYTDRPAAGRPGPGRPAAGRQGLFCKNFR